jgi:MFS family permease
LLALVLTIQTPSFYSAVSRAMTAHHKHIHINNLTCHSGVQNPILFAVAVAGALLSDRVGRRRSFWIGALMFVVLFPIITALSATNMYTDPNGNIQTKSPAQTRAFLAMIYIFSIAFPFCYTPLQVIYRLECLRFHVRAKGLAFTSFIRNPFSFTTDT